MILPTPTLKAELIRRLRLAGRRRMTTPELVASTGAGRSAVWNELATLHRLRVVRRTHSQTGPRVTRWTLRSLRQQSEEPS